MEYYDKALLANVAWAGAGGDGDAGSFWNSKRTPLKELGPDWAKRFHVWRMDWDERSIKLYCDDRLLNAQDLSVTLNERGGINPFHQPAYLLLDQAIGGTRGGDPAGTAFPVRFEVDYVRVYQKP